MSDEIKTRITDLPSTDVVKNNDVFMISRPTNQSDNSYVSYQCGYSTLSSQITTQIKNEIGTATGQIEAIGIVKNREQLSQTGTRLVQENVIYEISQQSGGQVTENCLLKNTSARQSISGPIEFKQNPTVSTVAVESATTTSTVNYEMMQQYVRNMQKNTFMYGTSDSNQTILATGQAANVKGYALKITNSAAVRFQIFSTTEQWIGIYAQCSTCGGELEDVYRRASNSITDGTYVSESGGWYILTFTKVLAKTPQSIIIPLGEMSLVGGNVVGIFPVSYNATSLTMDLKITQYFQKNTTFKVQQF